MLPFANAQGTDEHDQRATCPNVLFERGLPGLSGREAVPVEKWVETRLLKPRRAVSPPRPTPPANS